VPREEEAANQGRQAEDKGNRKSNSMLSASFIPHQAILPSLSL
jgi:hypothetical protein